MFLWCENVASLTLVFNTLRPRQYCRHFADGTFKRIFMNENVWILIMISLKFVPKIRINNIPGSVQIMAWHRRAQVQYLWNNTDSGVLIMFLWCENVASLTLVFNTLRPRQYCRHFADGTFKRIFMNENVWILIMISLKFVPKVRINNIPGLVQIMAWYRRAQVQYLWNNTDSGVLIMFLWCENVASLTLVFNTLRPRQYCRHFADGTFKRIFMNENVWILIMISLKFVPKIRINNIPGSVQIMAWHRRAQVQYLWNNTDSGVLIMFLWCENVASLTLVFNTLRPRQYCRHFADGTFKRIFMNENVWILIMISLKFVPKVRINNIPGLVQIMAWYRRAQVQYLWNNTDSGVLIMFLWCENVASLTLVFNTLRPRQYCRHFADGTFKRIFMNENVWILIMISLKLVPKVRINNIPGLVQIMAWRRMAQVQYLWNNTDSVVLIMFLWCENVASLTLVFNTLRPRRYCRHFADGTFKRIFMNENVWILIMISLKFVPKVRITNIPGWVQIMAWRRRATSQYLNKWWYVLLTHICITRPQWILMCSNYGPDKERSLAPSIVI